MIKANKYKIDSFKMLFDASLLSFINIPEKYYLIDESGEVLQELKKKGYEVPYNEFTSIFISKFRRVLPDKREFNKIVILFSSKAVKNYFDGIAVIDIMAVLNFLKDKNIIGFYSVSEILKNSYFKDLDICQDVLFSYDQKEWIISEFKRLKDKYISDNRIGNGIRLFNNDKNYGLVINNRNGATINKPFFKIYNKGLELFEKHTNFFNSLDEKTRYILNFNLILRYEYTLKNSSYFKKFKISNNVLFFYKELSNIDKMREIKRYFYDKNFYPVKPKRIYKDLPPQQKIIAQLLLLNMETLPNYNIEFYEKLFLKDFEGNQKTRMQELFDKVYGYIHGEKWQEIHQENETTKQFYYLIFG